MVHAAGEACIGPAMALGHSQGWVVSLGGAAMHSQQEGPAGRAPAGGFFLGLGLRTAAAAAGGAPRLLAGSGADAWEVVAAAILLSVDGAGSCCGCACGGCSSGSAGAKGIWRVRLAPLAPPLAGQLLLCLLLLRLPARGDRSASLVGCRGGAHTLGPRLGRRPVCRRGAPLHNLALHLQPQEMAAATQQQQQQQQQQAGRKLCGPLSATKLPAGHSSWQGSCTCGMPPSLTTANGFSCSAAVRLTAEVPPSSGTMRPSSAAGQGCTGGIGCVGKPGQAPEALQLRRG